jgi:predicted dehydrogenase
VGCGAICEEFYLPAFRRHRDILDQLVLVDNNEQRLSIIKTNFGVKKGFQDYHEILGEVDGVIVATPHSSHSRIAIDFLREGAHVLCEKPLAITASDAKDMIMQAERFGVTLSVNNVYRLYPSFRKVKELILDGSVGEVRSITYLHGHHFSWPTVSGFYFGNQSRKGVLLDQGAHALDAICWWVGCRPDLISCQTDSYGGPEAQVSLKFRHGSFVGEAMLSWLTPLLNRYEIDCERACISGGTEDWGHLTVRFGSAKPRELYVDGASDPDRVLREKVVDNFLDVIRGNADPLVPASEVVDSIQLIEESYAAAERFEMPWCDNVD